MKIGRVLPPAAAPISVPNVLNGLVGLFQPKRELLRFSDELKKHFDVKHCFLVSSGKAALYCILKALHAIHPEKNEVLLPAFTCYCVASAVVRAGLKVRLCDIDSQTLDFDSVALAKELENSERLLCVVPTHLFGLHAQVETLRFLAKRKDFAVVEDAAQVMGGSENNAKLGLLGDVGFYSLARGKALSTCEGGIIVTNDDKIGAHVGVVVKTLPQYGLPDRAMLFFKACIIAVFSRPSLFWIPKSLPFLGLGGTYFDSDFSILSLSGFQAGMSRGWNKKLECLRRQRNKNIQRLASFFKVNTLSRCFSFANNTPVPEDLLRFPVRMDSEELCAETIRQSDRAGLGITITYPLPLCDLPELAGTVSGDYPAAKASSGRILTLPIHPFVNDKDAESIIKLLLKIVS
jgi:dTDP-4-amino-4,6-dideoxygalactose transaminase